MYYVCPVRLIVQVKLAKALTGVYTDATPPVNNYNTDRRHHPRTPTCFVSCDRFVPVFTF